MSSFFPINTPLINYFFYKAPFVSNTYVLTNISVSLGGGGSGYSVNDVIVLSGGSYTSPAVLKVNSVSSGSITGVSITSAGQYVTTQTSFTQASTNGSGTGATFDTATFGANITPIGPNIPLSGGFIYFYADEDHTLQIPTYSDVSDPNNPVVNLDPIQLGAAGDCPLFYLEDRLYYIVITDNTGDQSNPVTTINHYNPTFVAQQTSAFNDNFISNPQFNYPIEFWKSDEDEGKVTENVTEIAWGWDFIQDEETTTNNIITFEQITGEDIEGSPKNELVLTSDNASITEANKDIRKIIGLADFLSSQSVTFCALMQNKLSGILQVKLFLEIFYGVLGSPSLLLDITTFQVNTSREKYVFSFEIPDSINKVLDGYNYCAIRIQPQLGNSCIIGITNVMLIPGIIGIPVFVNEPVGLTKGQIIGEAFDIDSAGLEHNLSSYYYQDGEIIPYADTGTMVVEPVGTEQIFREICDGSVRKVSDYSDADIPYRRLYDVIGKTFGGDGELIVTSKDNVVTFTEASGGRAKSAYTAGTTSFVIANPQIGLPLGINFLKTSSTVIRATWYDNFAPIQTPHSNFSPSFYVVPPSGPLGYWGQTNAVVNPNNITFTTINPGSVSDKAIVDMSFNNQNIFDYASVYKTNHNVDGNYQVCGSFIEFSTFANNVREIGPIIINNGIGFLIDGIQDPLGVKDNYIISVAGLGISVPFLSGKSLSQNLDIFVKACALPFIWTVTVGSAPLAGQYFLASDNATDYYGWFTVDGVGVDPMVASRTGVEIAIFSGDTNTIIAEKIAEEFNDLEFNLPTQTQIIDLGANVKWYINL